jgi:hypothetical protein
MRIAVRATAMESSDLHGVSVAQERPERSEHRRIMAKGGIHTCTAEGSIADMPSGADSKVVTWYVTFGI